MVADRVRFRARCRSGVREGWMGTRTTPGSRLGTRGQGIVSYVESARFSRLRCQSQGMWGWDLSNWSPTPAKTLRIRIDLGENTAPTAVGQRNLINCGVGFSVPVDWATAAEVLWAFLDAENRAVGRTVKIRV